MQFDMIDNAVNRNAPLLYRIVIDGRFYYIGCANSARRPLIHYGRNVQRLKDGKAYRKNKPDGFRAIHRQLFEASQNGWNIVIELLRNVSPHSKFSEESREIELHRLIHGDALLNSMHQRLH
jgi:hypothetical protein